MKISIITPTFNSQKTIAKNIKSVLSQTYTNFEQIVVDNLSSDETIAIVKELYQKAEYIFKLKIISEKDNGIADAFNKGIRTASGDIIGILNSDDYLFNNYVLARVAQEFENHNIFFVHGDVFFEDAVFGSNQRRPLQCPIYQAMPFNHPTMFLRKEIYVNYGFYNVAYKYSMDFEFVCRLEKQMHNFKEHGKYIQGDALVHMSGSGTSWLNERHALKEMKQALQFHRFWNLKAAYYYTIRLSRIKLKKLFSYLGFNVLIKYWRNIKWRY